LTVDNPEFTVGSQQLAVDNKEHRIPNSQPPIPNSRLKAGFSVPKKKFRSSVHRHRVRRLMVEAWRLNKQLLIDALPQGMALHVFLVFTGKEMPEYAQVLPAVKTGIERLIGIVVKPEAK
jgi:ribonuclease P protein component